MMQNSARLMPLTLSKGIVTFNMEITIKTAKGNEELKNGNKYILIILHTELATI